MLLETSRPPHLLAITERFLVTLLTFLAATAAISQPPAATDPITTLEQRLTEATEENRVDLFVELASRLSASDPERAILYAREGLRSAIAQGDEPAQLVLATTLSSVLANLTRYEQALKPGTTALELARRLGDEMALAKALSNLAWIKIWLAKYQEP